MTSHLRTQKRPRSISGTMKARVAIARKALLRDDKKEIASWIEEHDPYFAQTGSGYCAPIGDEYRVRVVSPEGTTLIVDFSDVSPPAKTFSAVRSYINDGPMIPNPSQKVLAALYRRLQHRRMITI